LSAGLTDRAASVFINCPFDTQYQPLFDAIVFVVAYCGLQVRSGLQIADAGELRMAKLLRQLEQCRFSIHDISRVGLDARNSLPRFNMPLELGMAIGMKHLGRNKLRDHVIIIMDAEPFRYQQFASDLSGADIEHHANLPANIVSCVRNVLATHIDRPLPSGGVIDEARQAFLSALPLMADAANQRLAELTFIDRLRHINDFIVGTHPL
jgi:hypothetical protein